MPRLLVAAAVLMTLATAAPALAQGRITGVVRDVNGRPIQGATIRAFHEDASPRERTSTTDDKGRWVLLGLRVSPDWKFTAEAPGFYPTEGVVAVRSTQGVPVAFTLRRDLGPIPGALVKDIAQQLSAAAALRDQGRYDEAIAAYEAIQERNQKLTSVHLVLAGVYRKKAESLQDLATRRTFLERAAAAYGELLKNDAENERARAELAAVQVTLGELK
jgi:hypothetical protein